MMNNIYAQLMIYQILIVIYRKRLSTSLVFPLCPSKKKEVLEGRSDQLNHKTALLLINK